MMTGSAPVSGPERYPGPSDRSDSASEIDAQEEGRLMDSDPDEQQYVNILKIINLYLNNGNWKGMVKNPCLIT